MRDVRSLLVACCIMLLSTGVTAAQDPAPEPTPASLVPTEHGSARDTMTTFLEAFYKDPADLDAAAACLDLSRISKEAREVKGREVAAELKEILDRTAYVRLDEIPDEPVGNPYVFLRAPEGEVVIAPTATGEWLFTAESVFSMDRLRKSVEDRAVVAGVKELDGAVSTGAWLRSVMPTSLRKEVFVLELWQWLGMLLTIFLGTVVGRAFVALTTALVRGYLRRRETEIDRDAALRAVRPLGMLVMLMVWGLGILWLGLPVGVFNLYYRALKVVAVVVAGVSAYRFIDVLSDVLGRRAERTDSEYDNMLVPLVCRSLKVFVAAVALVIVAQALGTDLTALVASLGIGGLALALAAQDTVSNFFGSLMVIVDRPFKVGDWVVVGDVEGTVEEVGFRSTRIRTFYNSLITLPNSNLIKASVDNLGDRRFRRWSTRLGLAYNTPPEKIDAFCEGIRELVRRHPYTRKDYFHIYFNEFGADSLEIMVYVFFETPDWATELRERHRLGVDIIRLGADLGIEFAFPTQTLYMRREEWEAPASAGEGYPEASSRLEVEARKRVDAMLERTVAGTVPPPVEFERPPEQDGGDGGE